MIERYNLAPDIRLGLAHPVVPPANQYLHPKFYQATGNHLARFLQDASGKNVRISFDCGFVPCMFPEELKEMIEEHYKDIGKRCNPLPDILPDGNVVSCFPLFHATEKLKLSDYQDTGEIGKVFLKKMEPFRSTGIFPHCTKCDLFLKGECYGGCRAQVLNRFKRIENGQPVPSTAYLKSGLEIIQAGGGTVNDSSKKNAVASKYTIPYIDQPPEFWEKLNSVHGESIRGIYFPLPDTTIPSGRPVQPMIHLASFLEETKCKKNLIINPIVLPDKVEKIGPSIIQQIEKIIKKTEIREITLSNVDLARLIRKEFPEISLTASTLMDIASSSQLIMLEGLFDTVVPSGKILRNIAVLNQIRKCFQGEIRLLVNEACLPGCVHRIQHFYEMGSPGIRHPESLCRELLFRHPWLRLTGAWILPQFLDLYDGLYDDLKLAGRSTLRNPDNYLKVLTHYFKGKDLSPNEIGGGPASVNESIDIDQAFFKHTLYCDHNCFSCNYCRVYWEKKMTAASGKKSQQILRKKKKNTDKFERVIQRIEHQIPPETDFDRIQQQWEKVPGDYHNRLKTMPSPEWLENGLLHGPDKCWKVLQEKISKPVSSPYSLYVHVPFCDRKCNFCDCYSMAVPERNAEKISEFTRLLLSEIALWTQNSNITERPVTSIHFGGGTPGYLPPEKLHALTDRLRKGLKITDTTEIALESTTSLLSGEQLRILSEAGFRRLLVGVQTLDDPIRKILGRKETAREVLLKLEDAMKMGFVVSVDVLYGLPFQHAGSLLHTLAELCKSGIHGFSLYQLNITDKNKAFFANIGGFKRSPVYDYFLFQLADQYLIRSGYKKNHFVHYAKKEDRNLYYNHVCRNEDLLALGPTADGIFDDYYYVHQWIEEYLSHKQMISPPLQGGGYLKPRELERRLIKARLIGGIVPESDVTYFKMETLFEKWLSYDLIEKSDSEFRLTGSGSWHISKMVEELMQYGL